MSSAKLPIIALVGRANVGKSSLFNLLVKARRNIVAREAGTTRDSIAEIIELAGKPAWLTDTAGLKDPDDEFEAGIQEQIETAIEAADLICLLIDASAPISSEDRRLAKKALKSRKKVVLIANKVDRNHRALPADFLKFGIPDILLLSTTTRVGFKDLLAYLEAWLPRGKLKREDKVLKIALIGRPNVGKSALFNALIQKQQAYVSKRAGTTRDVNRHQIKFESRTLELLDTAGVRRSGKIQVGVEKFSVLRTLAAIEESEICLLLLDVSEPATAVEQKIAGLVKEAGKGLIIIITKWDNLQEEDDTIGDRLTAKLRQEFDFVPWASLVFTSAVTGRNVTKIFELVLAIDERRNSQITTSKLNLWLQASVRKHPPAGLKNTHPKLNYVTQIGQRPPTFQIFGRFATCLHWGYKRFLERQLRETFDLEGTALRLRFREKDAQKPEKD